MTPQFDIVIPTAGRPCLSALLRSLARAEGPRPGSIVVVDDRARLEVSDLDLEGWVKCKVRILSGRAGGPASARNIGWRACRAGWVAFLDDDVVVPPGWLAMLARDLEREVAASQGNVVVPRPAGRKPTDWERNTIGLETATWATADMAYRRRVLQGLGGFDERFRHPYREDADLALRARKAGHRMERGRRTVFHPVRDAGWGISLQLQRGNRDDVLMRAIHGRTWRSQAGVPAGRRPFHLAITAAGVAGFLAAAAGKRRLATGMSAAWLAGTVEFAARRISGGPGSPREVLAMILTSALIPPVAAWHWLAGFAGLRQTMKRHGPVPSPPQKAQAKVPPAAVLLDRDGTLIKDVPYNADPACVQVMPGALGALDRLRRAGIPTAVISNQSGVARGLITPAQLEAVNRRVEAELGPLGPWFICTHGPQDSCGCRKPSPRLILAAAAKLGVDPSRCAYIGDIGSDMQAAAAAGARPILVPTEVTLPEEVRAAPDVAADLNSAVDLLLDF